MFTPWIATSCYLPLCYAIPESKFNADHLMYAKQIYKRDVWRGCYGENAYMTFLKLICFGEAFKKAHPDNMVWKARIGL